MDNKETQTNPNKPKSKLTTSAILILVAVVAIVGVFLYLYVYVINQNSNKTSGDKVVATVNNVAILKKEVDEVTVVSKESPKSVLDKLIKTQILNQYLAKIGFTVSADEIEQNIKADQKSNPSSKLDSKLDLIGRKIKAYYSLDNQGLDKKYAELKSAAKVTIHVQL